MKKKSSYSLAYISAGWIAFNNPLEWDMWQEMLHYYFVVDEPVRHEGKLVGIIVREFTRDEKAQYLPDKKPENQVFWSLAEFMNKITYNTMREGLDPYNAPEDGKDSLVAYAFRQSNRDHREFVCRECKLEIEHETVPMISFKDGTEHAHVGCVTEIVSVLTTAGMTYHEPGQYLEEEE